MKELGFEVMPSPSGVDITQLPDHWPGRPGMLFRARNGMTYQLITQAYKAMGEGKGAGQIILQTRQGWFYPQNVSWFYNHVGEGSIVRTPDGKEVEVKCILPNGTERGGRTIITSCTRSWQEAQLEIIHL